MDLIIDYFIPSASKSNVLHGMRKPDFIKLHDKQLVNHTHTCIKSKGKPVNNIHAKNTLTLEVQSLNDQVILKANQLCIQRANFDIFHIF